MGDAPRQRCPARSGGPPPAETGRTVPKDQRKRSSVGQWKPSGMRGCCGVLITATLAEEANGLVTFLPR